METTIKEFFEAIKAGDISNVKAMLELHPALLNATNEGGQNAFLVAKYYRNGDVADLLLGLGPDLDIFTASAAGNVSVLVELLADDRSLVEKHSSDGWTPLHLASFFGQTTAAEVLLANGADVNGRSTNAMANTPLHAAVAGRQTDVVPVLLSHGAAVNARQHGGWTALHGAAQNGDLELVHLLVAHGAEVGARADNQQSALDLALTKGHKEVAALLEGVGPAH